MMVLKERAYAEGSIVIQLCVSNDGYMVVASNFVADKNLEKKFESLEKAETFYNIVVGQQDAL